MISMNCPNCGLYIGGTALHRVQDDVSSADAHCPNKQCGAIYRVSIVLLHPGQPVLRVKYVTDEKGDVQTVAMPAKQQSKEPL